MRLVRIRSVLATFIGVFIIGSGVAYAQANLLWTNSAGAVAITAVDKTTGALVRNFPQTRGNGRGVVTVGNTIYFTVADSGTVYLMDATTGVDMGPAFTVAGATGLSNMAFDGTNFWISDYSGTPNAFYYSPTGTLLNTISLANCTSFCDGLEFFNGNLISNRGDSLTPGIYDIYSTAGALLTPNFITGISQARGIAYDGTDFYISSGASTVLVHNATTGAFVRSMTLTGVSYNLEDLSLDYQIVIVPTMPEGLFLMLVAILMGSAVFMLRRRARLA